MFYAAMASAADLWLILRKHQHTHEMAIDAPVIIDYGHERMLP